MNVPSITSNLETLSTTVYTLLCRIVGYTPASVGLTRVLKA
jgi:hypothetical protein